MLYISLGFKIQNEDTFSNYENQYEKAMDELKKVLTKEQYEKIVV